MVCRSRPMNWLVQEQAVGRDCLLPIMVFLCRSRAKSFPLSASAAPAVPASSDERSRACSLRRCRFARSCLARRSLRGSLGGLLFIGSGVSRLSAARGRRPLLVLRSPDRPGSFAHSHELAQFAASALRWPVGCGRSAALSRSCRSSGVEHSLGKGEVESSNLSGSTRFAPHQSEPNAPSSRCCAGSSSAVWRDDRSSTRPAPWR